MRLNVITAAVVVLLTSGSAFAQEWIEYTSLQDRFTANFPGNPKVTDSTFESQFGHRLKSRIYRVDVAPDNFYIITVVDYSNIDQLGLEKQKACPQGAEACRGGNGNPGNSTGPGYSKADRAGALTYASWQFFQRDAKVTYLGWTNISLVVGHQIRLTNNRDKSQTAASVFMHEDKLYIAEGTVPANYPEPGLFYQGLGWLDEKGQNIRYQQFYYNGVPKAWALGGIDINAQPIAPPAGRGGRGGAGGGAAGAGGGRGAGPAGGGAGAGGGAAAPAGRGGN